MIIDRLVLKNFKRFRDEEIRFRDGITGIVGNNGTGKSSIVEAIFFALYGVEKTGSLQSDYIISSFASPREHCEVRLDFRIGGNKYTVIRTFKNGKTIPNKTTFHKDGKLFATGVREVENEVRRTIGMGRMDFRNTIYAAQKDLLTLLETDPSKRKEWFLRALGIDYLKQESQNILKECIEKKTEDKVSLEGELKAITRKQGEVDLATLQASVGEFRNNLAILEKQKRELTKKKKAIVEQFQKFQDIKTEYTRLVERQASLTKEKDSRIRQQDTIKSKLIDLARLEQNCRVLEQKLSDLPEKKQAFETLRKRKAEFDKTTAEIRFNEHECSETKKRSGQLEIKIGALRKDNERKDALRAGLRKALDLGPGIDDNNLEQHVMSMDEAITRTLAEHSARQKSLENEKKKLLSDWKTIQDAGAEGTCPLCRQKLGSHYAGIEEEFSSQFHRIDDELTGLQEEQKHVQKEKDAVNSQKPILSEIRSLSEKIRARESLETDLKELISQIRIRESAIHLLIQKVTDLQFDEKTYAQTEREVREREQDQQRFNDLRAKLAQVSAFRDQVTELEKQIGQKEEEIGRVSKGIEQLSFDPGKAGALEKSREEIDNAISVTDADISRTTEQLQQANGKIAEYQRTEKQIRDLQEQIEKFRNEIELLELTRDLIKKYVVYLMKMVRDRLVGEVSRIISEITGGRYEQVLLDEDFNLLVRDVDNDFPIERFSGGEQDDIAVALRIALSRYLAELHQVHESTFLIFDEIFGSQDEERRNNLLTALRTQESRFPQILLISHIAEMQGEFANTLQIEMGSDQSSRVREVV